MKCLGYFSKLIGMRSKLSKHGEIATAKLLVTHRAGLIAARLLGVSEPRGDAGDYHVAK